MLCAVAVSLILLCCIVLHQHANCKITNLNLYNNNIGADGARWLAGAVQVPRVVYYNVALPSFALCFDAEPELQTLFAEDSWYFHQI